MTKQQEARLPELLQNFIRSSEIEGLAVGDRLQAMCLSVLNGESTLEDCLTRINARYDEDQA